MNVNFNRLIYIVVAFLVMFLGLLSRRLSEFIPNWIDLVLGDFLWALMVYFFIRILFIKLTNKRVVFLGIFFCFTIEISQLYHEQWLEDIRRTTLGGLVLGYGFLWSDLIAYILGICFGVESDTLINGYIKRRKFKNY